MQNRRKHLNHAERSDGGPSVRKKVPPGNLVKRGMMALFLVVLCMFLGTIVVLVDESVKEPAENEHESNDRLLRGHKEKTQRSPAARLMDAFYQQGFDKPARDVVDKGYADEDTSGLRGYYAKQYIEAGDAVVRLPADHLICEKSLDRCFPLEGTCEKDETACEQRYLIYAAYVGRLRAKRTDPATDPWFQNFFEELPQDFLGQHPFFATTEELSVLDPSPRSCHFEALIKAKREAAHESYKLAHAALMQRNQKILASGHEAEAEECNVMLGAEPVRCFLG